MYAIRSYYEIAERFPLEPPPSAGENATPAMHDKRCGRRLPAEEGYTPGKIEQNQTRNVVVTMKHQFPEFDEDHSMDTATATQPQSVITSYSIHYTKLYELSALQRGDSDRNL